MPRLWYRKGNKSFSNDRASILSDSNTDLSSDDDGCSSTAKQGRLHTNKHSRWSDPDEQRLLAYTTEGKSWE